ncbi:hypothetical protein AB4156_05720 [Cupriavidus sp. 2MCAB6]|uniref:hypothetical protein n=1 Tax=Cupriavidus sp. 2MCAB6 TaxID=3232981 RepID=UPI003F8DDFDC
MTSMCRNVGTVADTKTGGKPPGVPGAMSPFSPVTMAHDEKNALGPKARAKSGNASAQLAFAAVAGRLLDPL